MIKTIDGKETMTVLYVSVDGKDNWSGLYETPTADGADGPLATLEGARKAVKMIGSESATVKIRGGEYFMKDTVIFGIEDGREKGSVTYEAYPDETPVLTSGVALKTWELCKETPTGLPEVASGKVYRHLIPDTLDTVLTMYDGREQLVRAHGDFFMPAIIHDYERMDSLNVAKEEDRDLLRRVDFEEGQLRAWPNIHDIELRFMPVPWTMNLIALESVDISNNTAWLEVEATAPLCAKSKGIRVENAIDYLDEPGRWCVNTQEGYVYYWPLDDLAPSDEIIVPSLKEYIRVEGDIDLAGDTDIPVKNLHFKGLTLKYGKVDRTDKGYKGGGIQHDWEMHDKRTSLIGLRGAQDCSISDCHIHSTSGGAIRLDLHCQNILIENNLIDQIGAMGILLCGYGPGTKDVNKNNTVRNNIVSRCGEEMWHGHAIFLWQSGNNIIEHNRVHNSARKAIGLCGVRVTILRNPDHKFDEAVKTIRWDEMDAAIDMNTPEDKRYLPFLHTRDNIVRNNEIYKCLEKIGDGSTLNISGAGENNLILYNYLHHISTHNASGVMRVDDWQRGTTFEGNVIYKSNISAIVRKNYNHIIGNVIADCNCAKGYLKFASYPGETAAYGSKIEGNVFYDSGDRAEFFGSGYLVSKEASLPENCEIRNNVYYVAGAEDKGMKHIEMYAQKGLEEGSIVADPGFIDLENGDLSFVEDSPVFALGIKQVDQSVMGITDAYPAHLLEQAYYEEDTSDYDRGHDNTKETYEWW